MNSWGPGFDPARDVRNASCQLGHLENARCYVLQGHLRNRIYSRLVSTAATVSIAARRRQSRPISALMKRSSALPSSIPTNSPVWCATHLPAWMFAPVALSRNWRGSKSRWAGRSGPKRNASAHLGKHARRVWNVVLSVMWRSRSELRDRSRFCRGALAVVCVSTPALPTQSMFYLHQYRLVHTYSLWYNAP